MTTWISKGVVATLALTGLAACEDGQGSTFLQGATAATDAATPPLPQAKMAFGAVTLVAPEGYCIDKASLRQTFALMARCEALGASTGGTDAPVGIITASFAAAHGTLPTPSDTATAHNLDSISDAKARDASVTFRAKGAATAEGFSTNHWRGTARIGNQVMGLALFGPAGGRATSAQGRAVLTELIAATNAGS